MCLADRGGGGVHGVGPARHVATSAAAANKSRKDATGIAFETGKVRGDFGVGRNAGCIVCVPGCQEGSHQVLWYSDAVSHVRIEQQVGQSSGESLGARRTMI